MQSTAVHRAPDAEPPRGKLNKLMSRIHERRAIAQGQEDASLSSPSIVSPGQSIVASHGIGSEHRIESPLPVTSINTASEIARIAAPSAAMRIDTLLCDEACVPLPKSRLRKYVQLTHSQQRCLNRNIVWDDDVTVNTLQTPSSANSTLISMSNNDAQISRKSPASSASSLDSSRNGQKASASDEIAVDEEEGDCESKSSTSTLTAISAFDSVRGNIFFLTESPNRENSRSFAQGSWDNAQPSDTVNNNFDSLLDGVCERDTRVDRGLQIMQSHRVTRCQRRLFHQLRARQLTAAREWTSLEKAVRRNRIAAKRRALHRWRCYLVECIAHRTDAALLPNPPVTGESMFTEVLRMRYLWRKWKRLIAQRRLVVGKHRLIDGHSCRYQCRMALRRWLTAVRYKRQSWKQLRSARRRHRSIESSQTANSRLFHNSDDEDDGCVSQLDELDEQLAQHCSTPTGLSPKLESSAQHSTMRNETVSPASVVFEQLSLPAAMSVNSDDIFYLSDESDFSTQECQNDSFSVGHGPLRIEDLAESRTMPSPMRCWQLQDSFASRFNNRSLGHANHCLAILSIRNALALLVRYYRARKYYEHEQKSSGIFWWKLHHQRKQIDKDFILLADSFFRLSCYKMLFSRLRTRVQNKCRRL